LASSIACILWLQCSLLEILLLQTVPLDILLLSSQELLSTSTSLLNFFANLLAGGICIAIPLLIMYGGINIFYPRGFPPMTPPGEGRISRIPYTLPGPMAYLYRTKTDLYVFFLIGLSFIFGAVYASLGLALSLFFHNRYVVLATPFILYEVGSFIMNIVGKSEWSPVMTLIPFHHKRTSWLTVFGGLGVIFS